MSSHNLNYPNQLEVASCEQVSGHISHFHHIPGEPSLACNQIYFVQNWQTLQSSRSKALNIINSKLQFNSPLW